MIERMFTDIAKFMKSQGELHYVSKTMLKIPYTGKSRLVLEAVNYKVVGPGRETSYVQASLWPISEEANGKIAKCTVYLAC